MIRRTVERLWRMDAAELAWRGAAAARTIFARTHAGLVRPRWIRDDLLDALAAPGEDDDLLAVRAALSSGRWDEAHRELSDHFARAPRRFVVGSSKKAAVIARIRGEFPDVAREAAARADRILAGQYDVLGYRGLRFHGGQVAQVGTSAPPDLPDWHLDPVHRRRPPLTFWSTVPYLAPACGDHKIIWELNRHQHWIALGRAFWLTGDTKYRDRFIAELRSWLDANPPLIGVNWASMLELGFRSISWVWAIHLFAGSHGPANRLRQSDYERDAKPEAGHGRHSEGGRSDERRPWLVDLLLALDRQLTHIERNLSYYFSPNTHLLGEALALYVAGRALPELAASPRREATGRRILLAEIDRQIAADGGHCERSTHYHRYTLDFYSLALAVARITGDDAASRFEDAVGRLGYAARLLADDRGRTPHIGDDDGGALLPMTGREPDDLRDSLAIAAALLRRPELQIGPAPEEAVWMLGPELQSAISNRQSAIPPLASAALRDTGYYVSRSTAGDHLVIDGGPLGYQNCGHAHADALSLTFSVRGVPLLIDTGTGSYTADPALRDRLRSTALHNTLTLDDRPQSVSNGPFRWSHIANSQVHTWRTNDRFDYFDGGHDGYRPVEHRRHVLALHGDLVVVADLVRSAFPSRMHTAAVHWHFDPRWTVDARSRRAVLAHSADKNIHVGLVVPQGLLEHFVADAKTGLGWQSPVYGRLERTTTVRVSQSGTAPFWMVSVFDLDPENPVADVEWVPVRAEAGAIAHATAIRITRAASVDHVLFAEPSNAARPLQGRDRGAEPAPHLTWRVGEFETDARMLFCRTTASHPIARLGLVDGSMVLVAGRRDFQLALPRVVPDFSADYGTEDKERMRNEPLIRDQARTKDQALGTKDQPTCVASPVS
jgi:hypothetical protein